MEQSQPVLVVYGATSYTASNHLLPYLAAHPDANRYHLVLAGRNADKLAAVDAQLPSTGPRREIVVLRLEDENGVEALVQRANVIVNFAGPYQSHGAERLIKSCAQQGTHYIDLCGEVNFMAKVVQRFDFQASKTGAIIVPACGFESAPADLVVYTALRTLQEHVGRDQGLRTSTNFYDIDGGMSGGTIASVGAVSDSGEGMDPDFQWALCPYSLTHTKTTRSLIKRSPVNVSGAPSIGGFFVGEVVNLPIIRRSHFLSRMGASSLRVAVQKTEEPRHSANTDLAEAFTSIGALHVSNIITAYLYSILILLVAGVYASSSLIRDGLAAWIPQPGEGPSMESCLKGHTRITNVSESDDGKLAVLTQYTGRGDPGYSHTGKLIGEAALSLILPPPKGFSLPTLAATGGVLTPSTGMGSVFIERLRLNGVATIQSEIVEINTGAGKKNV